MLLNELLVNPSGNDHPYEYAELVGTVNAAMGNLYIISMRGDADVFSGNADAVIDLSVFANGSSGYTIIRGANGFTAEAGSTVITRSLFDTNDNFQNASTSYLLVYSPQATIAEGYDFDWANTGTLSLPGGAVIVDAVGFQVPASGSKIYGGNELVQAYTPQAMSRVLGNTTPFTPGWFRGTASGANDSLAYSSVNNTDLPVTGAALTPGGPNASAATPLTTLTNTQIDTGGIQRSMVRSLTFTFSNPILNMASNAFKLTDQNDNPITGVVLTPSGIGTNTLSVTFSGSPIIGTSLADGKYRITVDGDQLFAAGRMVDAKNDGNPGSNGVTDFHRFYGDYDGDATIAASDFIQFRLSFGGTDFTFDFDGDGAVAASDFIQFRLRFGGSL